MLIEEMSPKIYKWQKRNKNNNKHNFTKYVAGAGANMVFFCRILSYTTIHVYFFLYFAYFRDVPKKTVDPRRDIDRTLQLFESS